MAYPATVAKFQRAEVDVAADGNVKAVYQLVTPMQEVIASVTILKTPQITFVGARAPQRIVDMLHKALCLQHVDDTLKTEAPDAIQSENAPAELKRFWSSYGGYKLGYKLTRPAFFGRSQVPIYSDVYRFCYIKEIWTIEYRFDYPQGYDAANDVKSFMHELDVSLRSSTPEDAPCKPIPGLASCRN